MKLGETKKKSFLKLFITLDLVGGMKREIRIM
jgi:hypothetical protein